MDRALVYAGALPQDTDLLNTNLFMMLGQAALNAAVVGNGTAVSGLACTPTAPASLVVNVGTGSIYATDPIDSSSYGSLGSNSNNVIKQGILQTALALTVTPPGTVGFSQVYLVQAILQDIDTGATVLNYYNSANPAQPFSGPANSGSSQMTIRSCKCTVALKAGVAATTGTQTTPSPDAGYTGLYAITVANGATQITSGNIAQLASAPFFPSLSQVPAGVQGQTWVYAGTDTGSANAYIVTFVAGQPIPAAYTAGMRVVFKALTACTGASTVNVQGLGVVNIKRANGVALAANDIVSGQLVELTYDGTNFQMVNFLGTGTNTNSNTIIDIPYIADSGSQNAIIATFSPSIGSYSDGLYVAVKLANAITGACTINANGLGVKSIVLGDGTNPPYNVFVAGQILLLVYSTAMGKFQIANVTAGMFYRQPTANYSFYVNTSIGDDNAYDGTSATVSGTRGPFKTIQKGINTCWSFAPSPFTITLNIAAGTYSESVSSPTWAASKVFVQGAGQGVTIVNSPASLSSGIFAFVFNGATNGEIHDLTIQGGQAGLVADQAFDLYVNNVEIAGNYTQGQGVWAASGASITLHNLKVSNNMSHILNASSGGQIGFDNGSTITINAPIAVTDFAFAALNGNISANIGAVPSFVNPSYVSGSKYTATALGAIYANTLGVNFFPGTTPGTTSFGGQYVP